MAGKKHTLYITDDTVDKKLNKLNEGGRRGKSYWAQEAMKERLKKEDKKHDTGTGLEARVEVLEKKVERLEGGNKI
jgi:predicted transcriptional regulator